MMADVWGLAGQLPNGRETSDVKSGYNLSVACSIYAGPLFKACNRNYQIASRRSLPSIISPTAAGNSQRTALPQELNLIGNLGREQNSPAALIHPLQKTCHYTETCITKATSNTACLPKTEHMLTG